jgi:hypothetical protein
MPATTPPTTSPRHEHQSAASDDRLLLLKEVDFKWLMAGQGWWIDTTRLHDDSAYAAHLLDLVDAGALPALRDCATLLRAHSGFCSAPCTPKETSGHELR